MLTNECGHLDNLSSNGKKMWTKNVNKNKYFRSHFQSTFCSCLIVKRIWALQIIDLLIVKKCRLKMIIKFLGLIFSQHFCYDLIFLRINNTGFQIKDLNPLEGQEMQTKNDNKNKYFRSHFLSTFCSCLIVQRMLTIRLWIFKQLNECGPFR